jgi:hypothetical protein
LEHLLYSLIRMVLADFQNFGTRAGRKLKSSLPDQSFQRLKSHFICRLRDQGVIRPISWILITCREGAPIAPFTRQFICVVKDPNFCFALPAVLLAKTRPNP